MRILTGLILLCLLCGTSSVLAFAIENTNAKIVGHLELVSKNPSCSAGPTPACNTDESNLTTHGLVGVGYNLYALLLDGSASAGVSGAAFGVEYGSNLYVASWSSCATSSYPDGPTGISWPESGSGNVLVWNSNSDCQDSPASGDEDGDVSVVLGIMYVYAYGDDTFEFTQRDYVSPPDFSVSDCGGGASNPLFPQNAGIVGFGTEMGYDPCASPEDTTGGGGSGTSAFLDNRLIVNFLPEMVSESEGRVQGKRPIDDVQFDNESVRSLLRAAKTQEMEPLFPFFSKTHRLRNGKLIDLPVDVSNYYRLTLEEGRAKPSKAVLDQHREVFQSVTLDKLHESGFTPNDPHYPEQWWLNNTGQFGGDGTTDLNGPETWDSSLGASIQVGVLDSGVDLDHDDINVIGGPTFAGGSNADDTWGHGSSIAGIIGAIGDNGNDGAGINWNADIVAIKIQNEMFFPISNGVQGVAWAVANNLPVFNMSWVGFGVQALEDNLKNAHAAGLLPVAAMGNENSSNPREPASYSRFVTSVGAMYLNGNRWEDNDINSQYSCSYAGGQGSNTGNWIDLSPVSWTPRNGRIDLPGGVQWERNEVGTAGSSRLRQCVWRRRATRR